MKPEYILGVTGVKDLHSYGRMRTIGLVLRGVEVEVLTDDPTLN